MQEPEDQENLSLLILASRKDEEARNRLWSLISEDLRMIARKQLRREWQPQCVSTNELINELFLKIGRADLDYQNRNHFFAVAAKQLRLILIDDARHKNRAKRGGQEMMATFTEFEDMQNMSRTSIYDVHAALEQLEAIDPRKSEILEMHYFGGMGFRDIAQVLEISVATVTRDMRFAKAWLKSHLQT